MELKPRRLILYVIIAAILEIILCYYYYYVCIIYVSKYVIKYVNIIFNKYMYSIVCNILP